MIIWAWIVLVLNGLAVFTAPLMVGRIRDKWYPLSMFIDFISVLPIVGRVIGWW